MAKGLWAFIILAAFVIAAFGELGFIISAGALILYGIFEYLKHR